MDIELTCIKCGWTGNNAELVAITDNLNDAYFAYCPVCEHSEFDEEEVD